MPSDVPKNWPLHLTYLKNLQVSPSLPPTFLQEAEGDGPRTDQVRITRHLLSMPCPLVRIRPILSSTHPAHGQCGLFALRQLPPSSFILLYLGALHDRSTEDPTSNYDLCIDRDRGLSVDATRQGNEARFINDYRGVHEAGPNAEFRDCWVQVGASGHDAAGATWEKRIGVFVLGPGKKGGPRAKGIAKGEEILVSYGKGFWQARQ